MKFNVFHRETGLSLKQYLKNNANVSTVTTKTGRDYSMKKICPLLHPDGYPGFCYYVEWEGYRIEWLHPNQWEVRERVKSNDVPHNQEY